MTPEELSALSRYSSFGEKLDLLDPRDRQAVDNAFGKIQRSTQKEIRKWKPTEEGAKEFRKYAQEAADFANRFAEDSPLRNDIALDHLFRNATSIQMDREEAETAKIWQAIKNADAISEADRLNAQAALANAMNKELELKSEGYKNLADAASKQMDYLREPVQKILEQSKDAKAFGRDLKLLETELLQNPSYKAYSELYADNLGKLGDRIGVSPIMNLIYKKGWLGMKTEGMVESYVPGTATIPGDGQSMTGDTLQASTEALMSRLP